MQLAAQIDIQKATAALPQPDDASVLSDLDGAAPTADWTVHAGALILVRPDGRIAFCSHADAPERLHADCRHVFGQATEGAARCACRDRFLPPHDGAAQAGTPGTLLPLC
ncbi:hypothetical protein [Xanthomonas arboricola]|uniref:hypothetical protein n=1 Tax=Xanthomonas arboricola TaxID=56448 RepID=UPI002DD61A7D|nr:hypothetical protein [Xanthomonas arboricola]